MVLDAEMHHHELKEIKNHTTVYEWQQEQTSPFDELLISWNAHRPQEGYYTLLCERQTGDMVSLAFIRAMGL